MSIEYNFIVVHSLWPQSIKAFFSIIIKNTFREIEIPLLNVVVLALCWTWCNSTLLINSSVLIAFEHRIHDLLQHSLTEYDMNKLNFNIWIFESFTSLVSVPSIVYMLSKNILSSFEITFALWHHLWRAKPENTVRNPTWKRQERLLYDR